MNSSMHRARAREVLRGNWGIAILVSLVAGLIGGSGFNINFEFGETNTQPIQATLPAGMSELLLGVLGIGVAAVAMVAVVMSIVSLILGGVVELGSAKYHLNLIDGREATFNDLFSQFDRFGPALAMHLLKTLYITLWSLLFVIPGIVAAYSYAMAPYIMLEDPNCSASEAIRRSKAMMNGHKGELFGLDMSFIGWMLLATLTMGIGNLFLTPYQTTARASFYRNLQEQPYRRENPAESYNAYIE